MSEGDFLWFSCGRNLFSLPYNWLDPIIGYVQDKGKEGVNSCSTKFKSIKPGWNHLGRMMYSKPLQLFPSIRMKEGEKKGFLNFYPRHWRSCSSPLATKTHVQGIWRRCRLTWARLASVSVFTRICVEKWQFGQGSLSWGERWTGVGLSHCWKLSRLIRRHVRIQRASFSSPLVWQGRRREWISIWGSRRAGGLHDLSGIILQPTRWICKQHWSIWRSFYKWLQFLKMTDHYNKGAGAGGLLIWIMAWR